jgi:hypothetical protein
VWEECIDVIILVKPLNWLMRWRRGGMGWDGIFELFTHVIYEPDDNLELGAQ